MPSARLERSTTNRMIAGVCGGIAEYLAIDSTVVRVLFFLMILFTGGLGLILYVALVFLMPLPGRPATSFATSAGATVEEVADQLRKTADDISKSFRDRPQSDTAPSGEGAATTTPVVVDPQARARETERRRMAFGYLLMALGVIFLLGNAGLFRVVQWQVVWPVVLIAVGALLLVQRVRS
ncbi:MAG TPA: PspC domain-containing protein [Candidatus Limnocylindria bacterium]|nr:PspC domain-containing protein [Candidatus Limnocylindria bacterium]